MSITSAGRVLIKARASAPASTAARAKGAIDGTLGASLGNTGNLVRRRTAATTEAIMAGSVPKEEPPAATSTLTSPAPGGSSGRSTTVRT